MRTLTALPRKSDLLISPIALNTDSDDQDRCPIIKNDWLVAILVRLADHSHAYLVESWFPGARIGLYNLRKAPVFDTPDSCPRLRQRVAVGSAPVPQIDDKNIVNV